MNKYKDLDEIIMDAIIDSYGFEEQLCSWFAFFQDELIFPIHISILSNQYEAKGITVQWERLKFIIYLNDMEFLVDINLNTCNKTIFHSPYIVLIFHFYNNFSFLQYFWQCFKEIV